MKRYLVYVLCIALAVLLFAGCSAKTPKDEAPDVIPPAADNDAESTAPADEPAAVKGESTYDFLSATLTADGLTVCLTDIDDFEDYPSGKDLPVMGLSGDYIDVFVGPIEIDWWPLVFLLCADGSVEYVDVLDCMMSGEDITCGGKLHGLDEIEGFTIIEVPDDMHGSVKVSQAVDEYGVMWPMDLAHFFTRNPEYAPPGPDEAINMLYESPAAMDIITSIEAPESILSTNGSVEEIFYQGDLYYCTYVEVYEEYGDEIVYHEFLAIDNKSNVFRQDPETGEWQYVVFEAMG